MAMLWLIYEGILQYYAYMSAASYMPLAYSVYHYGTPRNVTLSFNYRF